MPRHGKPNPEWKELGAVLVSLRELSDRSRREVAAAARVRPRPNAAQLVPMKPLYLRNVELGTSLPSRQALDSLLSVLGVDRATVREMLPVEYRHLVDADEPDSDVPMTAAFMSAAPASPGNFATWSDDVQVSAFLTAPAPGTHRRGLTNTRSVRGAGGQSFGATSELSALAGSARPAPAGRLMDGQVPRAPSPADGARELADIYAALGTEGRHKLLGRARQLQLARDI